MDLVGKCLIAKPCITDSLFEKSVVYIYEQTRHGTAGLIINKRNNTITTHDILLNKSFDAVDLPERVYIGGPIHPATVILLHTNDWQSSNTLQVNDQLSVTSDDLMFYKYTTGNRPNGYKFCMGVSVWDPRKIADEIRSNQWLVCELGVHQILDLHGSTMWDVAVETAAKNTIDRYI